MIKILTNQPTRYERYDDVQHVLERLTTQAHALRATAYLYEITPDTGQEPYAGWNHHQATCLRRCADTLDRIHNETIYAYRLSTPKKPYQP